MSEPVTVERAKLNARIDGNAEDTLIDGWITTARRWVENFTGHILVPRDVTERFDGFGRMRLRAWPIAEGAAVTIRYTDAGGVTQTLADDRIDVGDRPAVLQPAFGSAWPSAAGNVLATVQAGYAAPADVPAEMVTAILLIVKGLYDDRMMTDEVERAAEKLCRPYRLWSV